MTRWLHDNGLTLALLALFGASLVGQVATGLAATNGERALHQEAALTLAAYLGSGAFLSALFENWESEFLQMWAYVESFQNWQSEFLSTAVLIVLAIWLREKGSPESKAVSDPHPKTGNS